MVSPMPIEAGNMADMDHDNSKNSKSANFKLITTCGRLIGLR
jgi:hypothetical protein